MKKLFTSIRQKNMEEIKRIIAKKPDVVNCVAKAPPKKDAGQSPLQVAIKVGDLNIAHYLLDNGADVNFMEADDGLSPLISDRRPVLCDAIGRVYFEIQIFHSQDFPAEYIEFVARLLKMGADPNKADNRGRNAWGWVILSYMEKAARIEDESQKQLLAQVTTKILDLLLDSGADIYHLDRKSDWNMNDTIAINNLILNRDTFYGIADKKREWWTMFFKPVMEILSPYYERDNPYYGCDVSEERKQFFEQLKKEIEETEASDAEKESTEKAPSQTTVKYSDEKGRELVQAITEGKTEAALKFLQENEKYSNYILNDKDTWKDHDGKSVFQIALDCGCDTIILHALIAGGVDLNYMPESRLAIPEGADVVYYNGKPAFYTFNSKTVDLQNVQEETREPIVHSVMKKLLLVSGLGGYEYADGLFGVAVHLLDKGADPNKKDSEGYTAWMKLLSTARMIASGIPDRKNEGIFMVYLSRTLRLLVEYRADIWEISYDSMDSVEDIVRNIRNGNDALKGLNSKAAAFWKGEGRELRNLINEFYSADYDTIIDENTKVIHAALGEKRYMLLSEVVERMENGDQELIKQIAGLFLQENTEDGNKRAGLLLQLCQ